MSRLVQWKRAGRVVRVGSTPYGLGVFARRWFWYDELIAEILGEVIDDPLHNSDYCMELEGGRVLEPRPPLRYINHSCRPNCRLVRFADWDEARDAFRQSIYLRAAAPIAPGEQLCIDYAWPAAHAVPCLCSSPDCRGWIVAREELSELLARHALEESS